jgi:hypothetical protein
MSATYTTQLRLQKPGAGDRTWNTPLNANADALDALAPLGGLAVVPTETPSTTLNVRIAAGTFRKADGTVGSYAGTASQALTGGATNYIYLLDNATLTISTSAYPTNAAHVRLATVVAGASTITGVADDRVTLVVTYPGVAPVGATYVVQTADPALTAEFALATLSTGLLKVTTGTGVLTTAAAGTDYQAASTTLTAVAGLATTGLISRTGSGTVATRTITGTTNQVTVTNGDGVAGNPILATPQNIHTGANPTFAGITLTGLVTITDVNVALSATTGTKVGTAATQKLSFWGVTPIVQPSGASQAAITNGSGGSGTTIPAFGDTTTVNQAANLANAFTALFTLVDAMRTALVNAGMMKGSA